jgi:hypothetical protein
VLWVLELPRFGSYAAVKANLKLLIFFNVVSIKLTQKYFDSTRFIAFKFNSQKRISSLAID